LEHDADIHAKDPSGHTALSTAIYKGNEAIILLLLSKGASLRDFWIPAISESDLLMWTDLRSVWRLKSMLADPDSRLWASVKPLHIACLLRVTTIAAFLIENGAEIEAEDAIGDTPLHYAAIAGHKDAMQLLQSKGADINRKGPGGWTLLHRLAFLDEPQHARMVNRLVQETGLNINATDSNDSTALHLSINEGSTGFFAALIEGGADVHISNSSGDTPLSLALKSNKSRFARCLLEAGADLNIDGTKTATPLIVAILQGSTSCVQLLVNAGACVGCCNFSNRLLSPLCVAIMKKSTEKMEILVKSGADPNEKGPEGLTAMCTAMTEDFSDGVSLLMRYGGNPWQIARSTQTRPIGREIDRI
jgi:uncharacterized protein